MTSLPGTDLGPFAPLAEKLQGITEALAATTTQREVIEIILTPAVQALGATAGIVLFVDQSDQQMKIAGSQGYEDGVPTLWQEGPIEHHVLISDILRMHEALYFEDAGELKQAYPELERRTGGLLPVANATLPMFLDHRPLGVIVLDFTEPHHFTPAERRFLTILSAQCAVALGRTEVTRTLEARVEERTRQLREEQAAQAAFVAFTEAIGSETNLLTLVRQAITVLQARFSGTTAVYYEEENHLWKARLWSEDASPELVAVITAGIPSETPIFAEVLRTRQPVFVDAWDADREGVASSEEYGVAAHYPLVIGGEIQSLLSIGLRNTRTWSEADRALWRSVGQSLNLALERTETARQMAHQNAELQTRTAELQARTRALEAFSELTRDLVVEEAPSILTHRAQQVVLSLLPEGYSLYFEPNQQRDRWVLGAQTGDLRNDDLQAVADAGLPYESAGNLLIPYTTLKPYYQDEYARDLDQLDGMVSHIGASATFPVLVRGRPRGVLAVILFGTPRPWSTVEQAVMETVVRSLGLALERAQGVAELAERSCELEQANHDLREANDELEAFTYSASHDLRTPVRHVMGFAELAQKELEKAPNENAQRYLEVVKQSALRMTSLIDGMLVLSRSGRQDLKLQPVDLNDLVTQARRDVGQEFVGHPVHWRIGDLPQVQGDREMLQQVVTNLLSNAVKYSARREQSEVEVWCEESASEWTICVRDNGVGFDPRYAKKLFGIFQRLHTQREFSGTGVGLATVRRIVLKHGGQVFAQSQEDSGATFGFTLPKSSSLKL